MGGHITVNDVERLAVLVVLAGPAAGADEPSAYEGPPARTAAGILADALRPVLADPALYSLLDEAELPADARSAFMS